MLNSDKIDREMSLLEVEDRMVRNNPWKTILIYVVIGFAWILFSDNLLAMFITDPIKFLEFKRTRVGFMFCLLLCCFTSS